MTRNVYWLWPSVCLSVPRHIPIFHTTGWIRMYVTWGQWLGLPFSYALLGSFAIGAQVSVL